MPFTEAMLHRVLVERYGGEADTPDERVEAQRLARAELERVVQFEVLVEDRDAAFSVDGFGQVGSDQAPWNESVLSPDGSQVLARSFELPTIEPVRLAFFLHFVREDLPLRTPYGDLPFTLDDVLPSRLRFLAPYEPIG